VGEIIEVSDTATDTFGYELQVGDSVALNLVDGDLYGTVVEITPSLGPIQGDIKDRVPMEINVRFQNGDLHSFRTTLIRIPAWRWVCDDVKRVVKYNPPFAHPQGA
jgi:hypothetical protein